VKVLFVRHLLLLAELLGQNNFLFAGNIFNLCTSVSPCRNQ
jgi:hypothetical protein